MLAYFSTTKQTLPVQKAPVTLLRSFSTNSKTRIINPRTNERESASTNFDLGVEKKTGQKSPIPEGRKPKAEPKKTAKRAPTFQPICLSPSTELLLEGIKNGNRRMLSKAITLVESELERDQKQATSLLTRIIEERREKAQIDPNSINTFRVGITGPPGTGKSTFVETLGTNLCNQGNKVAVIAIDPSSRKTGGSILGDRSRMIKLGMHENSFIRPSPSRGIAGGLSVHTSDQILLCEHAGYNVIIVETVGVGQTEVSVADVTDMFMLLLSPGGGDVIQGIKKGVVEYADMIVVNKCDGDLVQRGKMIQYEYKNAIQLLGHQMGDWIPPVLTASSLMGIGIQDVWKKALEFKQHSKENGLFETKRALKRKNEFWKKLYEFLKMGLHNSEEVMNSIQKLQSLVERGVISSRQASSDIVGQIFQYM
ncbi:methylmalonyl-coa mutase [Anaeramoeba flamelloides]|uniref:Methylmalonyl-coa mutase n=1 Tax=Anaeramoeba flamelloides TaxID=1746091 RepID=A0AAV7YP10_9EUKA|nr:methylmalonyl-coa mutase [Anaeramoeba flamelloides]|eukprot:Anaeramoba_flamelloidesa86674_77.p1 GENE.a86674_77~~a86674_77.p1  ORF type:complete len:424 (-),score=90.37 a86674_77:70-1341(-)